MRARRAVAAVLAAAARAAQGRAHGEGRGGGGRGGGGWGGEGEGEGEVLARVGGVAVGFLLDFARAETRPLAPADHAAVALAYACAA